MTSEGTTTYSWDYENRLIKVTTPTTTAEYSYDPFGRRIEKKVTESGATTTTSYFYDNQAILFEYDEKGSIGNRYIHGPGIDEPLMLTTGKDKYYYHADGLGSIIALTDTSGKVVQSYEYDSFGNLKDQKNRVKQPYTYTGREWDRETGLYYYRARYYDPMEGRFISKDPIGFDGGINFYNYAQSNPINYTDPSGEKVTINIWRGYSTKSSFSGSIHVTSDIVSDSFLGNTLEPVRNKPPVPPGTYKAKLRKNHDPWRIELIGVLGNTNIQIHKGKYPEDSTGCILVGTGYSNDIVTGTREAMASILKIIQKDCSEDITVVIGGIASTCATCHN